MKIDKIMKTKNGKYKIIFDNKDSLITHADIILNNGILFKKQLTTEDFNKINSENQKQEAIKVTRNTKIQDLFLK